MRVWTEQSKMIIPMPSEIIKNCTGHTHNTYIFQYILKAQRAILVDFPSGVCVCLCVYSQLSYGKLCFPVQTLRVCHYTDISAVIWVYVWVCACGLHVCSVLFFSAWRHPIGQNITAHIRERCTRCDCLSLLSSTLPLFNQSFNSNRLPKTHLDTALRGTGTHIDTLYCTFSITFYKKNLFIIVQSTDVVLQKLEYEHGSGGFSRVTFAAREKKKRKRANLETWRWTKKKAKMCSNVTQRPRGKRLHFDFSPVNS